MSFCIVLLTTDVTIRDGNNQINEWIVWILLEAVHVLNKCVAIGARHDGKVSIDQTQRQMIHILCTEANKELLLVKGRIKTDDKANIAPQFIRVLELDNEVFKDVEGILAVALQDAGDETGEVDRFVPVHALVDEWEDCCAHCVDHELIVALKFDEDFA